MDALARHPEGTAHSRLICLNPNRFLMPRRSLHQRPPGMISRVEIPYKVQVRVIATKPSRLVRWDPAQALLAFPAAPL